MTVQIRYAGSEDKFRTAQHTHTWKRTDGEIQAGPVMSASSGPKDYLKNDIIGLFAANPEIESVAMLVLNRTPFLIVRLRGGYWFDLSKPEGRQVEVKS